MSYDAPLSEGMVIYGAVYVGTATMGFFGGESPPYSLPVAVANGTDMDWQQVIKRIFDQSSGALKCVDAGVPSGTHGSALDFAQVIEDCYDPVNAALRIVFI